MLKSRATWLAIGLAAGLVIGLNVAGIWPQIPIHASATAGQDNFAMCTGTIDPEVEAVYLLDYVTGRAGRDRIWLTTPGELNDWWRTRSRLQLERESGGWRIVGVGAERARLAYASLTAAPLPLQAKRPREQRSP